MENRSEVSMETWVCDARGGGFRGSSPSARSGGLPAAGESSASPLRGVRESRLRRGDGRSFAQHENCLALGAITAGRPSSIGWLRRFSLGSRVLRGVQLLEREWRNCIAPGRRMACVRWGKGSRPSDARQAVGGAAEFES